MYLSFCFIPIKAQDDLVLHFENLTVKERLPSHRVLCVLQDSRGLMWFGTEEGLCKYDGYEFTEFVADASDPFSISNNAVRAIVEDSLGYFWVGTDGGGLNLFHPGDEKFTRIQLPHEVDAEAMESKIYSLLIDPSGDLWIGSYGAGLFRISCPKSAAELGRMITGKQLQIEWFQSDSTSNSGLHDNYIFCLYADNQENIWVGSDANGTDEGGALHQLLVDPGNHQIIFKNHYRHNPSDPETLGSNYIMSMFEDSRGDFWVCNWKGGLNRLDRSTGQVQRFMTDNRTQGNLNNNDVYCVVEDDWGDLWVATYGAGISRIDTDEDDQISFQPYLSDPESNNTLVGNYVRQILIDNTDLFWVITWKSGISKLRITRNPFHQTTTHNCLPNDTITNQVTALCELSSGEFLTATMNDGFCLFRSGESQLQPLAGDILPIMITDSLPIQKVYEEKPGELNIRWDNRWFSISIKDNGWIGDVKSLNQEAANPMFGTQIFNKFYPHPVLEQIALTYRVYFEDSKKRLWIGQGLMLTMLEEDESGELRQIEYAKKSTDPNSLKGIQVTGITEDLTGKIWISTFDALNGLDVSTGRFSFFTMKNGLPGNGISNMIRDDSGLLWLATENGIMRFDPELGRGKTFDRSDGLPILSFGERVGYGMEDFQVYPGALHSKNGSIIFGTMRHGIIGFHPDSVFVNDKIPNVIITGITIMNEPVALTNSDIRLTHKERTFGFKFSSLDYLRASDNLYRYRLFPFQTDWQYVDANQRFATYSNMKPGVYHFEVSGTNNDGVWNPKAISVEVFVSTPWWRSIWFICFIVTLVISILAVSRVLTLQKHRILDELKLERIRMDELDRFTQMRILFFTNVTHEFRTPLTLILGPVEQLLSASGLGGTVKKQLYVIRQNASRLLGLVNQLIDFRKLEKEAFQLQVEYDNLSLYLNGIKELFNVNALAREIDYEFESDPGSIWGWFDKSIIDKILFNLLSNAFKFTSRKGSIRVVVTTDTHPVIQANDEAPLWVKIVITDNGIGMPPDQALQVFDRFYQVDHNQPGSGMGLAIVAELIKLHHGKVELSTATGQGSEFIVQFPLHESFYPAVVRKETSKRDLLTIHADHLDLPIINEDTEILIEQPISGQKAARILVVEDNAEMRSYIRQGLSPKYLVTEMPNAEEALRWLDENDCDLVLSDIMMHGMGGLGMTNKIKQDIRFSHLPVFLITALGSVENQMNGYGSGADDYFTKPFDLRLLSAKIGNQLRTREEFRKKFQTVPGFSPTEVPAGKVDQDFLDHLVGMVNGNISDPEFGVRELVDSAKMSQSALYRKVKSLTGLSMNEFIVLMRVRMAYQILKSEKIPVKEVAYRVGFNDPKYFSTCFRKHYGASPSEVLPRGA